MGTGRQLVGFSGASYAHGLFVDAGWPAVRFFKDANAAHMFARLPVAEAIRWLETLASDDPETLLGFAERRLKEDGARDAIAAVKRLKGLTLDPTRRNDSMPLLRASTGKPPPRRRNTGC